MYCSVCSRACSTMPVSLSWSSGKLFLRAFVLSWCLPVSAVFLMFCSALLLGRVWEDAILLFCSGMHSGSDTFCCCCCSRLDWWFGSLVLFWFVPLDHHDTGVTAHHHWYRIHYWCLSTVFLYVIGATFYRFTLPTLPFLKYSISVDSSFCCSDDDDGLPFWWAHRWVCLFILFCLRLWNALYDIGAHLVLPLMHLCIVRTSFIRGGTVPISCHSFPDCCALHVWATEVGKTLHSTTVMLPDLGRLLLHYLSWPTVTGRLFLFSDWGLTSFHCICDILFCFGVYYIVGGHSTVTLVYRASVAVTLGDGSPLPAFYLLMILCLLSTFPLMIVVRPVIHFIHWFLLHLMLLLFSVYVWLCVSVADSMASRVCVCGLPLCVNVCVCREICNG